MEVFEWPVNTGCLADETMLRHARLPALTRLVWAEEVLDNPGTEDPVDIFFHNLPPTLVDLHLHDPKVGEDEPALASIFDYVCNSLNIESLTLSGINGQFLSHVFWRLTSASEMTGGQQSMRLPKLKAILIKGTFTLTDRYQYNILQMLEFRFMVAGALHQDEPFRFGLPCQVVWSVLFKTRIKKMITCGLKVTIFEGAQPVDWL